VAFDFDGTLVDSNAIKRGTYFDVLAAVPGGRAVLDEVLSRYPGADRHGVLTRAHEELRARGAAGLPPASEWVDAYSRLCEERVIACDEIPGAGAALAELARGHALYLASATPEDALVRVVAGRGWSNRFAGVYGGPRSKVENLERIAVRQRVRAEEIVYVGDGAVDREAAAAFGCAFFGWGTPVDALPTGHLAALAPLVREICRRTSAG
jgi:phosphoglycolate phosphatase